MLNENEMIGDDGTLAGVGKDESMKIYGNSSKQRKSERTQALVHKENRLVALTVTSWKLQSEEKKNGKKEEKRSHFGMSFAFLSRSVCGAWVCENKREEALLPSCTMRNWWKSGFLK